MDDAIATDAARDAGLAGWKAAVRAHPEVTGRFVAVLTSPDFNPETGAGRIVARPGKDRADAFAAALHAAKGETL